MKMSHIVARTFTVACCDASAACRTAVRNRKVGRFNQERGGERVALDAMALVSISEDETLRYWNSHNEGPAITGHSSAINCIMETDASSGDYRPDNIFVTGSDDSTLMCWNSNGTQLGPTLEGHRKPVTCVAMLPDRRVVSGSNDLSIRIWRKDGTSVLLRGSKLKSSLNPKRK